MQTFVPYPTFFFLLLYICSLSICIQTKSSQIRNAKRGSFLSYSPMLQNEHSIQYLIEKKLLKGLILISCKDFECWSKWQTFSIIMALIITYYNYIFKSWLIFHQKLFLSTFLQGSKPVSCWWSLLHTWNFSLLSRPSSQLAEHHLSVPCTLQSKFCFSDQHTCCLFSLASLSILEGVY